MKTKKAFFFDRDGIINRRIVDDYVTTREEFIFEEEIFSILADIKGAGFLTIVVTNQQGIAKRLMTATDLEDIHRMMQDEVQKRIGSAFDDIYYCGEYSSSPISRRKPSPAMLLEAIHKWQIDPVQSWMIGDSVSDATAGKHAGVRTILIGSEHQDKNIPDADYVFSSLGEFISSPLFRSLITT